MKSSTALLIGVAAGFIAGNLLATPHKNEKPAYTTVLTRIDTLHIVRPETVFVRQLCRIVDRLPVADSLGDSAEVEVPISQSVYKGDSYTAYISGYRPRLDSIDIFRPVNTVFSATEPPKKRFALGLSAGYAATPAGLQPYVGIGITLKLWEF